MDTERRQNLGIGIEDIIDNVHAPLPVTLVPRVLEDDTLKVYAVKACQEMDKRLLVVRVSAADICRHDKSCLYGMDMKSREDEENGERQPDEN